MRRIMLRAALATGLALSLTGCERRPVARPAGMPLRLAMDLWAGYFPALLADDLGYARERGLSLVISLPGNTDRMMADFAAGQYDLVAVALADLVNLTRGAQDVQVVIQSDESAGGDQLVSRPDYRADAPRIVVGTNLGGFGELFVREYLQRRGIDPRRVVWVNVDAADVGAALQRRDIDLGHSWNPYAAAAVAAGAVARFTSAETPGLIPDVVATRQSIIAQRGPDVRAFAAAWFQAQAWWRDHPVAGHEMLARRLGKSSAWVAEALQGIKLASLEDNRRMLGAGGGAPAMAAVLARYSDFFVAHGTLTRPLEPRALLRADLLP